MTERSRLWLRSGAESSRPLLFRVHAFIVLLTLSLWAAPVVAQVGEAVLVDDVLLLDVLQDHSADLERITAGEADESFILGAADGYDRLSEQLRNLDISYVEDGFEASCSLFLINLSATQMHRRLIDFHVCATEGCSESMRESVVREIARLDQRMTEKAADCVVKQGQP